MSLFARKSVFAVYERVRCRHKTGKRLEILDIETREIILFQQQTTNALFAIHGHSLISTSVASSYMYLLSRVVGL